MSGINILGVENILDTASGEKSGVLSAALSSTLRSAAAIFSAILLGACASTTPGGRSQLAAPAPISSLYSSLDLTLTLAALAPVASACVGVQCAVDRGFERQAQRLGSRLADVAYGKYPELKTRVPQFKVVVAEKSEGGISSDASGSIVIYRGVRKVSLDEEALAYLIAAEMGRVIARHHDEKSAATIISSLIAQVVLAPANLARGVAFIASSTASAFGKDWIAPGNDPDQLREADIIALDLLAGLGWSDTEIADSLHGYSIRLGACSWAADIERVAVRLGKHGEGRTLALAVPSAPQRSTP